MSQRRRKKRCLNDTESCAAAAEEDTATLVDWRVLVADIALFLSDGTFADTLTESAKKEVRKKAANYCLIDGELHHGIRHPKPVVSDSSRQLAILASHHITSDRHLSYKETLASVRQGCFWPDLPKSVRDFVTECRGCCNRDNKENAAPIRQADVWRKVLVSLHGPFGGAARSSLMVVRDPVSGWRSVKVLQDEDDDKLSHDAASFIFATFCRLGFTNCRLQKSAQSSRILQAFSSMWDILGVDGIQAGQILEECQEKFIDREVEDFVTMTLLGHPEDDWGSLVDAWLFQRHISETGHGRTAFSLMFNRDPLAIEDSDAAVAAAEEEEMPLTCQSRRKLKSAMLNCRHCQDVFTSRISFQLHQQRHLERAKKRGIMEGEGGDAAEAEGSSSGEDVEEYRTKKRSKLAPIRRVDPEARVAKLTAEPRKRPEEDPLAEGRIQTMTTSSVSAVKALLAATRDERTKRGKYFKYSPELRDEIAEYALKHGVPDTCEYFSGRLDSPVTGSTVRNFIKSFELHSPELKEELGKFTYQFGLDRGEQECQERHPGVELNRNLLKRFKSYFLRKFPHLPGEEDDELMVDVGTRNKIPYDSVLKGDIGRYAFHCGNVEAVKHFSEKLQFPIKESTVRKFKKVWMDRNQMQPEQQQLHQQQELQQPLQQQQQQQEQQQIIVQMQPVMGTHDVGIINGQVIQGGTELMHSANYQQFQQQPLQPQQQATTLILNQVAPSQGATFTQVIPINQFGHQVDQQHSQIFVQQQQQIHYQQQQQQYSYVTAADQTGCAGPLSLTVNAITTDQDNTLVNLSVDTNSQPTCSTSQAQEIASLLQNDENGQQQCEDIESEEEERRVSDKAQASSKPCKRKTKRRRGKKLNTRGQYANYDPEMRAKIGKFATDHSNQETIAHFFKQYKVDLPESTVRGLRDKYLVRCKEKKTELNEMNYGPRGRPMRLGKYDVVVKNCIKELVASGEKMSSFLAIATAKQVLMQNEPSMLVEYGGEVNLNPTWAKSFLKRIGVRVKEKEEMGKKK